MSPEEERARQIVRVWEWTLSEYEKGQLLWNSETWKDGPRAVADVIAGLREALGPDSGRHSIWTDLAELEGQVVDR